MRFVATKRHKPVAILEAADSVDANIWAILHGYDAYPPSTEFLDRGHVALRDSLKRKFIVEGRPEDVAERMADDGVGVAPSEILARVRTIHVPRQEVGTHPVADGRQAGEDRIRKPAQAKPLTEGGAATPVTWSGEIQEDSGEIPGALESKSSGGAR